MSLYGLNGLLRFLLMLLLISLYIFSISVFAMSSRCLLITFVSKRTAGPVCASEGFIFITFAAVALIRGFSTSKGMFFCLSTGVSDGPVPHYTRAAVIMAIL